MSGSNALDEAALSPYLEKNVPGFHGLQAIEKFNSGQSNPTLAARLVSFTTVSPVGDWGVADRPRPADRACGCCQKLRATERHSDFCAPHPGSQPPCPARGAWLRDSPPTQLRLTQRLTACERRS